MHFEVAIGFIEIGHTLFSAALARLQIPRTLPATATITAWGMQPGNLLINPVALFIESGLLSFTKIPGSDDRARTQPMQRSFHDVGFGL